MEQLFQELELAYIEFDDGAFGIKVPTKRFVDYSTGEKHAFLIVRFDGDNLEVFVEDCFDLGSASFLAIGFAAALAANAGLLSPVFDMDAEHEAIRCYRSVKVVDALVGAVEFRMLLTSLIRFLEHTFQTIDIAFRSGMLPRKLSATFEELEDLIDEVGGLDSLKAQFRRDGIM